MTENNMAGFKRTLLLPFIKVILDIITIEAAVAFAFYLRFFSPLTAVVPVTKGIPALLPYLYFSLVILVIYISTLAIFQSYRPHLHFSFSQEVIIIFKSSLLGILIAMSAAFMYRESTYSRIVFFLIFFTTLFLLLIQRYLYHLLKLSLSRKGYFILNLFLAGSPAILPEFYAHFRRANIPYFRLIGFFSPEECEISGVPYLGSIDDLNKNLAEGGADGLVLAFDQSDAGLIARIIDFTEGKNIEMFYYPEVFDLIKSNIQFVDVRGLFLLKLKSSPLSGWQGFIKRIFDIVVSLCGLLLLSPLLIFIALLIKLTSRGPAIYQQERIGMDGKAFRILKFRSMKTGAESGSGPVWASQNDPRVTAFGKFLRRTSLDELPQLINVITGEMSLVGPRPERPHFVQEFKTIVPKYQERHRFRSGMTGWAQVNGLRGQSSIEDRTRYDIYYIENWSLMLDLKILILTIVAIFRGDNAY
jgi:exopolysaccharide biosynthesis polyprenyl glycosylphosphotransferase